MINKASGKKILIVDDDAADIFRLQEIINSDYVVIKVDDGSRAVEMVKSKHPDLVLLDVMMPKVSGYSICAHLKSNPDTKEIPVVMMTGLDTGMNRRIGAEMGADGYLVKPIKQHQLHNVISRFLK